MGAALSGSWVPYGVTLPLLLFNCGHELVSENSSTPLESAP